MAGASAKKTEKNAIEKTKIYAVLTAGAAILSFVVRIGWLAVSLSSFLQFSLLSLVGWLAFSMIRKSLKLGVGYALWQDLYVINLVVQIGSLLTSWAWVAYLAIPAYGVYKFGNKIKDWVFTPTEKEQQVTTAGRGGKRR